MMKKIICIAIIGFFIQIASVNAGKYLPSKNLKMSKIYESLVSAINKFELDEQITIFSGKSAANFKMLNTALRTIKNDRDLGQIIGKQINSDTFLNYINKKIK